VIPGEDEVGLPEDRAADLVVQLPRIGGAYFPTGWAT
jgi:hypothetical protein